MKCKQRIALLLVLTMIICLMGACGNSTQSSTDDESIVTSESNDENIEIEEDIEENVDEVASDDIEETVSTTKLPVVEDEFHISTWYAWPPPLEGTSYTDPSDFYFFQQLSEKTGVTFDFVVISMPSADEQFSLMLASDSLPDLLTEPSRYSGSDDAAIENEVFMDLTDLVAEYAPNFSALIESDKYRRDAVSDSGRIAVFREMGIEEFSPNTGLLIRQDWLDDVGMDVPETYDELHDVLVAFKEIEDASAPFWLGTSLFDQYLTGGLGFADEWANIGGTAVYSPIADGLEDYLTMLNQWYEEGLLYSDFYSTLDNQTQDDDTRTRLVNTNQVGVWANWCEDTVNYDVDDDDYVLVAMHSPTVNKGDELHFALGIDSLVSSGRGWAVSAKADIETATVIVKIADWLYSKEGSTFASWGTEGYTFEYDETGQPYFTDVVMNNDELSANMAIGVFTTMGCGYLADYAKYNQNAITIYSDMVDVWSYQDNSYGMPNISLTSEEQERYSDLYSDIDTYVDETVVRFITGEKEISELDDYLNQLKEIGVDEMVGIYQNALDRYMAK